MPKTKLYLFGAPRLEYQNQTLPIDTRKALALLAYLLIEGKPQSRDTLATLLWPESNQTSARGALRRTLSTLRSALPEDVVDFGREVIALQPDRGLWSDVTTFRTRLEDCRTHGHPEDKVCPNCLIPLQQAAELYTGDFMAGFSLRDSATFDDWQFLESDALRRELAGVLECLVTLHQMQGEFPLALNYARRWLTLDSLNEAAHRALITLYAQNNQRSAALRQYRECVRALGEELGVHPLAETTQLYEAVKENRLDSPEITELKIDQPDKHGDSQTLAPNVMDTDTLPLVGRDTEWAELTRIYNGLRQNGVFAALIGEAGVGKTRLAQDFITHLKKRGAVTLSARCYAGENNLAYSSLIDLLRQGIRQAAGKPWWQGLHPRWLNEAALLIPELPTIIPDFPSLQPNNGPGAQSRFYEGFCQILTALVSGPLPGLIFIDNVELADESTLELLAYLVRRLQGRPVFLLVSWQTESVSATVLLEQILNDAIQQGYGSRLLLKSLQPHQALDLIEQFNESHQSFSSTFKQQLVESSQGLPFFLVEYLQATLRGEISSDEAADE
ncbi:MAG: AAA family ATPase, partial [Anaerolineae bacterium]|nr:AAA family ATPase [Anaerolineae bacterium]